MFSFQEYISAWLIYMACSLGLLVVFWQMTKHIPWYYLKQSLRLIAASLLLTPNLIENSTVFWSPAWLQSLLKLIFNGTDDIFSSIRILLISVLFTLLVFFVLSMIIILYKKQKSNS